MQSLRNFVLLDKLREAASGDDPVRLRVVRDVIRQMKLIQLERVAVADDEMVLDAMQRVQVETRKELDAIADYLEQAQSFVRNSKS